MQTHSLPVARTRAKFRKRVETNAADAAPVVPAGEALKPLSQVRRENNISRHTLWRLQKLGLGPTVIRLPSVKGNGKQLTCDTWWREFVQKLPRYTLQMTPAVLRPFAPAGELP